MHKYPFIRLFLPLVAGIGVGDATVSFVFPDGYVLFLLISLFLCITAAYFLFLRYAYRWVYGTFVSLFFFALGFFLYNYHRDKVHIVWNNEKQVYIGKVTDIPKIKKNAYVCEIKIEKRLDSLRSYPINKKILFYFSKDTPPKIYCGDRLILYTRISKPVNKINTAKFDYARYLTFKKISGIAYSFSGNYKIIGKDKISARQKALLMREKLLSFYRECGFKGDELAVLSALTLGYKEELTEEIKENYAVAGVSHILALSGLHLGLFYIILDFIFQRMFPGRNKRWFRAFLIIFFLWSFAFLVGLPVSVIRSATMFSIFAFSRVTIGRYGSLNVLAATGFFMLIYNPFFLFDVGFQLSFAAVTAIIIYQPCLVKILTIRKPFLRYIWTLFTVSLAAQLGTAPLILYYFSQFPVYFWLTNLLVIPLATLILYGTAAIMIFSFIPFMRTCLCAGVNEGVALLNYVTRWVELFPGSSLNCFTFSVGETLCFYLALGCFSVYRLTRKSRILISGIGIIWMGCLIRLLILQDIYRREQPFIWIYDSRDYSAIQFVCNRDVSFLFMIKTRETVPAKGIYKKIKSFCLGHSLRAPLLLPEMFNASCIWRERDILSFGGKTFCILKDDSWRNKHANEPLKIDYLYVSKGFKGSLKEITGLFRCKRVILDASLPSYLLETLEKECRSLGLDFISISEKGSLFIPV